MYELNIGSDEKYILNRLNEYGKGYIVGGYIRDKLLDIEPKDCDYCTDIDYDRLFDIFNDMRPISVGKSFGVLKIHYNNKEYDIAHMRDDVGFTENRRNTTIEFTNDISIDLARRDFTINAIAYDGKKLIPVNDHSLSDIDFKIIRFIGLADERIKEDPLRMLRAIRIFVEKDLSEIEENTLKAIENNHHLLKNISGERIRDEFVRILLSKHAKLGIIYLLKTNLLQEFLPELYNCYDFMQHNPHHSKDVFGHTLAVLDNVINEHKVVNGDPSSLQLRLAALLHDIGKPLTFSKDENGVGHFYDHDNVGEKLARQILNRLKFDNDTIDKVTKLIGSHMSFHNVISEKAAKRLISRIGMDNVTDLGKLVKADIMGSFPPFNFEKLENSMNIIRGIISRKDPISTKDLKVTGNDLIDLGITSGPEIGKILRDLLELILDDPSYNDKTILLQYVKDNYM